MRATSGPRGVTLVELLVALAASAIVLVAVVASVKAQQEAFNNGQRMREAQANARNAFLLLEQKLALAGYGMDPALAFDLTGQPGDPDPTPWYLGPCPAQAVPCAKDRTDGSDELVFHARNPGYWADPNSNTLRGRAWQVTGLDAPGARLTLDARTGDLFLQGQILQGVCDQGAGQRYFTVKETQGETRGFGAAPLATDHPVEILLQDEVLTDPFKRQSAGDCQPRRVFLIDRYRYHVRPTQVEGRWDGHLVLDRGLDLTGPDGARDGVIDQNDEAIIATGIEILQVAYEFTPNINVMAGVDLTLPPAGSNPGIPIAIRAGLAGAATGAPNAITRTAIDSAVPADAQLYTKLSFYPYRFGPPLAAERATNHQGNVNAVHLAIIARAGGGAVVNSPGTVVPAYFGAAVGPGGAVFNLDRTPAWIAAGATNGLDGNDRIRLETTIYLPNLLSRRLLFQ